MLGTAPYPHRCSEQAASACSNLLPSTLNFIFLMKCHFLTSGRIIIKRNGHNAVLCRQCPRQLAPPLPRPALRGRLHSHFMFSAAGTSQASTQKQDGTGSSFPSLWLLFHAASGENRQAATPAAAAIQGRDSAPRTSKITWSTLQSPRRPPCYGLALP